MAKILLFDYPSQRVVDPVLPSRSTFLEVIKNVPIDAQRNEFFDAWKRRALWRGFCRLRGYRLKRRFGSIQRAARSSFLVKWHLRSSLILAERRCRARATIPPCTQSRSGIGTGRTPPARRTRWQAPAAVSVVAIQRVNCRFRPRGESAQIDRATAVRKGAWRAA